MFQAAQVAKFKLIFSFDYTTKPGPWDKNDVVDLINQYKDSKAYFWHHDEQPLVSTFEGPDQAEDWHDIKTRTGAFFVPSWSFKGAKKALKLADGVADGLFSWAAWPEGPNIMTTEVDASYLDFLHQNNKTEYMMPISPWFYTNKHAWLPKERLWKGDDLWWDRWIHVWYSKPEYVEIISWNDYGESHHIGPTRTNAMVAFQANKGNPPFNYALNRSHDAWRMFLPHVIDMYKGGAPPITHEGINVWYRLNHGHSCSTGGTTGNTASQLQVGGSPANFLDDKITFLALLVGDSKARVKIGNSDWTDGTWEYHPANFIGLWHGSAPMNRESGTVIVEITRNGGSVITSMVKPSIMAPA
ncbi:glycoside hydrolase [Lophiotrema nucula]|uniref:Glycoside hydrolase n=1 Tax=Lophiotrema nucula TaxID=690887 RepID=A0A6A5ZNG1_9PLEO|nr:glycoside hydrolase [Lophiotrema nucula]